MGMGSVGDKVWPDGAPICGLGSDPLLVGPILEEFCVEAELNILWK